MNGRHLLSFVRMRALYEGARLGMVVRGLTVQETGLGPGHITPRITYVDGRRVYRPRDGDAPPLAVFVHGLGSSVATWSAVLPVAARAVPTVAPDLPGYGRTPLPDGVTHASLKEKVRTIIAFLDAVSPDRPVQLIGQSMGGWIAALVAATVPDRVARLTLVNTAGVFHPQVFEQRALFSPDDYVELRRLWRSMWHRLPLIYWLMERDYLKLTRTPMVRGFLDSVEEDDFLNDRLSSITAPTLLVWGLEDRLISPASIGYLEQGIPDLRVRPIAGCGHVPQRECTRAFLHYVLPWLRGEEPPAPADAALRAVMEAALARP